MISIKNNPYVIDKSSLNISKGSTSNSGLPSISSSGVGRSSSVSRIATRSYSTLAIPTQEQSSMLSLHQGLRSKIDKAMIHNLEGKVKELQNFKESKVPNYNQQL